MNRRCGQRCCTSLLYAAREGPVPRSEPAGCGGGQPGQHLRVALPGDQVVHDVPAGDPVQVSQDRGDLDCGRFQQLLRALLVPGPFFGQVPPVAGVQPDDPELRGDCEAGGDGAAPGSTPPASGNRPGPARGGRAGSWPAWRRPARSRTPRPPAGRTAPSSSRRLPPSPPRAPARTAASPPAPAPLSGGGAEAAGLGHPPCRVTIGWHPDRRHQPGLADVDAAHPVPVRRLVGHLFHASFTSAFLALASLRGGTARGTGGERRNLTRVLVAAMNGPWEDRLPASG